MKKERNIALCIIFSIISCGIYGIYWYVCLNNESQVATNDTYSVSGVALILLSIITCGIYSMYWSYKLGCRVEMMKASKNEPAGSSQIIFLILSIFGFSIIAWAIAQDQLNNQPV